MRYGLIGEKLGHSFSKTLHEELADYTYDLIPLAQEELHGFMTEKSFSAINVTIPYKEKVIPYLNEIDPKAETIGAVNTIVNRNGRLCGYNTDYYGFRYLLQHNGIDPMGKKVLILGKGGAAKAVHTVVSDLGAREIHTVYYKDDPETITYEDAYSNHLDAQIIINTTPVGMYPKIMESPIDITPFSALEAVADVVYNPLRTQFILDGLDRGIPAIGGLEMLVGQAKYAVEIFLDCTIADSKIDEIYHRMLLQFSNAVLIGMSGCGKTTLGEKMAQKKGLAFVDSDALLVEALQMPIAEYFSLYGEPAFREQEKVCIQSLAAKNGQVISTGGGVVKDRENIRALRTNGILLWIKRDADLLESGNGRPLAPDLEAAKKLYAERLPLYASAADGIIENSGTLEESVALLIKTYPDLF